MANLEVASNKIADPRGSQLDTVVEGRILEIEVEVPGWTDSVAVRSPERPGSVRRAVERLLRDCGLPR